MWKWMSSSASVVNIKRYGSAMQHCQSVKEENILTLKKNHFTLNTFQWQKMIANGILSELPSFNESMIRFYGLMFSSLIDPSFRFFPLWWSFKWRQDKGSICCASASADALQRNVDYYCTQACSAPGFLLSEGLWKLSSIRHRPLIQNWD